MTTPTEPLTIDMLDTSDAPATAAPVTHNAPALQGSRELAAPPVAGPMAGALAFLQNGGSPEQLEKMMALQERWEAGEARKEFVAAMAAFKVNPPTILKDKRVYYETRDGGMGADYMHATLGGVTEAIVFGLAQHGISHRWDTKQDNGRVYVTCVLTHARGHSESTTLDGAPDSSGKKNAIQQTASTITYLQRYTLLAATGLATKDMPAPDDDGKGGKREEDPSEAFNRAAEGIDPKLVQDARDASLLGWKGLSAWIQKRTQAERKALEPISGALKDAALAADEVTNSTTKGMK